MSKQIARADGTTTDSTRCRGVWMQGSRPLRECRLAGSGGVHFEACRVSRRRFFSGKETSFFDVARGVGIEAASGPVRLARRRSIAGPIPAVSFVTGLYRFTQ